MFGRIKGLGTAAIIVVGGSMAVNLIQWIANSVVDMFLILIIFAVFAVRETMSKIRIGKLESRNAELERDNAGMRAVSSSMPGVLSRLRQG